MRFISGDILNAVLANQTWSTWTPVFTAISGSFTTVTTNSAKYLLTGTDVEWILDFTITTAGTASVGILITAPFSSTYNSLTFGATSSGSTMYAVIYSGGSTFDARLFNNANPIASGVRYQLRGRFKKL